MRLIPSGTFVMGSPEDEEGRYDVEGPIHQVTLTRAYWLADTPCTQAVYEAVIGSNPSRFKGATHPVEQVSWDDAQTFLQAINERIQGLDLRLPTEAQWEYACRAGTAGARYAELDRIAWYDENAGGRTHPVQQKAPNAWGLYDPLGNVFEWCQDWFGRYGSEQQLDPIGPTGGDYRVIRGGSCCADARDCRAASYRGAFRPSGADARSWVSVFPEVRLRQVAVRRTKRRGRSPRMKTAERSGPATPSHKTIPPLLNPQDRSLRTRHRRSRTALLGRCDGSRSSTDSSSTFRSQPKRSR